MIIRLSTKKSILWRNYLQLAKVKEVQLYLWSVCLSVFFLFYNGGFVILPHSLLKIPRNFAIIILGISADSGGRGMAAMFGKVSQRIGWTFPRICDQRERPRG